MVVHELISSVLDFIWNKYKIISKLKKIKHLFLVLFYLVLDFILGF